MGKEIERKFLVLRNEWDRNGEGLLYRQGYLSVDKQRVVRVRVVGNQGFITIKGIARGASRDEFEYEIPCPDANQMLDELCIKPLIEKLRYRVEHAGMIWEIDEFKGDNEGLLLAEVELEDENQAVELPRWIGQEVTGDPRYFNSNLVANPYTKWKDKV
ncbi:MAG: CYTH domain-containing protein [candidate division Zixibacteria bacterium]|nr:CYTH domain-containing protein [candidate division Zixibacteria bacterium]